MIYKYNRFKNTTMTIKGNTISWEDHIIQTSNISQIWLGNYFNERLPIPFILILFFIALSGASPVRTIVMFMALFIYILIWAYRYWKNKDTIDIHIKVSSGNVYSFVCKNENFTNQVYQLFCDLISQNYTNPDLCICFYEDGKIQENELLSILSLDTDSSAKETKNQITNLLKKIIQIMDSNKNSNDLRLIGLIEEFKSQVYDQFHELINNNSVNANLCIRLHEDGKVTDDSITIPKNNTDKQLLNIQSINTNNKTIVELQKLAMYYSSKRETLAEIINLIEEIIQLIDADDKEALLDSYVKFINMGLLKDCNDLKLFALVNAIKNIVYC